MRQILILLKLVLIVLLWIPSASFADTDGAIERLSLTKVVPLP